ncbi:MAG TPA: pyridoxamine 5'-phosphate oxidase family protein [Dehalococcoidia bacterium]|nr:pyridoxamine 5'-phosphate oxidase family protein [Dehalococcoidia bacterium]
MTRPRVDRPDIPYGILGPDEGAGLLPWSRVSDRLRAAYVYWLATASADGRPHAVPVWGVWHEETLYFSNGPTTRTGRSLAANPAVSVHLESGEDVVIIEGTVEATRDRRLGARLSRLYRDKYVWREPVPPPWWALRPRTAFAWLCPSVGLAESVFASTATRWTFGPRGRPRRRPVQ